MKDEKKEAIERLRELIKEIGERRRREEIKKIIPLSEIEEEKRNQILQLIKKIEKEIKDFFGIEEEVGLEENEIEVYVSGTRRSIAHFDLKYGKLRIDKSLIERYEEDPEFVSQAIAEELTHFFRYKLNLFKDRSVEEFLAHLAKLHLGYPKGTGEDLWKEYVIQREGKWLQPYEAIKRIEEIESRIESVEKYEGEKNRLKKQLREIFKEIDDLKLKLPLSVASYLEGLIEDLYKKPSSLRYFLRGLKSTLKYFKEHLKEYTREKIFYLIDWTPFREKEKNKLYSLADENFYKYKDLEAHAIGYKAAEKIFEYIKEGKIDPKELFWKDPYKLKKEIKRITEEKLYGKIKLYLKRLFSKSKTLSVLFLVSFSFLLIFSNKPRISSYFLLTSKFLYLQIFLFLIIATFVFVALRKKKI